jgi:hypothetical protein
MNINNQRGLMQSLSVCGLSFVRTHACEIGDCAIFFIVRSLDDQKERPMCD